MTNEYGMIADILNKFHTSSDWVKTVWLIGLTAIFLGGLWLIRDIVKIRTKAKEAKQTEPPSAIVD